jgi:electron transfer flavoprotein alpha subunit
MKLERILIYAEAGNSKINPVYYELLTKAKEISDDKPVRISCILLGSDLECYINELKQSGIDEIVVMDDERLKIYNIDYYSTAIVNAVSELDPDIILFGATAIGEELAPTIGIKLKTGVAAHCMDVRMNSDGEFSQLVPAFGGKVIGEIFTPSTRPKIASIKPGILNSACFEPNPDCRKTTLNRSVLDDTTTSIEAISTELESISENPIEKADFVICAGYGVAHSDISDDLDRLASLLHGAVGYTRPAIDTGMAHNENSMIGTSGKSVKPKVYLGVGVSGSTHHVCGMKDSELIISINTDPKCEMFSISDFKVIGDSKTVIRELVRIISEENSNSATGNQL